MRDPFDPTDAELREWAFSDELAPVQDFDLMVSDVERIPLLLELTASPSRQFFVHCLYLTIGDAVRSHFNPTSRSDVEGALDYGSATAAHDPAVKRWIDNSRDLLASPELFDYGEWCEGGLARRAVADTNDDA
jgi:hypothetical protein